MANDVLELADRLWRGELGTGEYHPVGHTGGLAEICDGVAFVPSFANVSALSTPDGLVLVDTGSAPVAPIIHTELRRWSPDRLNTAVFSHGHIDHVFGVSVWEHEAAVNGWPAPSVVAHEELPRRFDRYIATAGYNQVVNRRQFGLAELVWPTEYRYPDRVYADHLDLEVGGVHLALRHEKGETDDHTTTWLADRGVLCCGDLFIWASPNAGNPQKVQRYPAEWALALRRMVDLDAQYLLPGHGLPVIGSDRVRQALTDTAELLESLVDQTLALMNEGARLNEAIQTVHTPSRLADRPYLQAVYDEPEFIVRNVWRLYGGWWDGDPASLKPAADAVLAGEIAELAGGPGVLADRALALVEGAAALDATGPAPALHAESPGDPARRLAGHLVQLAWLAAPGDPGVQRARHAVFSARATKATSTMARGVFRWAANEKAPPATRLDGGVGPAER